MTADKSGRRCVSPAGPPFCATQIWALGFQSEVARWNEISASLLLCGTSNADFPLTSRAQASPCPKAYLFLTGRCSLASLVKPQTVDQICSQAHCADEGLLERGWASHCADKASFVVPPLLASLHPLFVFFCFFLHRCLHWVSRLSGKIISL